MYAEFGTGATDTITLTNTYRSGGLTTAKIFNILLRQISCNAAYKWEEVTKGQNNYFYFVELPLTVSNGLLAQQAHFDS